MMGMATTPTAQANATMPLSSSSLASLSAVETFFLFLWEKRKEKIKSCGKTMLLQGDVTQLTTILTRSN